MLLIVEGLDRNRFSPSIVVLNGIGSLRAMVPSDVPVHDIGEPRLRHGIGALYRLLKQERPDIVLSTMAYLNFAVLLVCIPLMWRGVRVVVREANAPPATLARFPIQFIGRWAYRFLYPLADRVICNSESVRSELHGMGVRKNRIDLVDNPIDVEKLRTEAADVVIAAFPDFVASGRLTHQKGFDRLIDWFKSMPDTARLTILGTGPRREDLEKAIVTAGLQGQVVLAGFLDRPWMRIAGATAFLMPSRWEGMPNAALEALALGVPVIATHESGGLITLAKELPAGSLTIARDGSDFMRAIKEMKPATRQTCLRPSLLPDRFRKEEAIARYAEILLPVQDQN